VLSRREWFALFVITLACTLLIGLPAGLCLQQAGWTFWPSAFAAALLAWMATTFVVGLGLIVLTLNDVLRQLQDIAAAHGLGKRQ
jgi:predicted CDP-diglyceride synthetase/phosphatidate cytidylyltransferase